MVELQLKKAKFDADNSDNQPTQSAQGTVLTRNDLLDRLMGARDQNNKNG